MGQINAVILQGWLGKDPTLSETSKGNPMVSFDLASSQYTSTPTIQSAATPAEIATFYQATLAEAGWEPLAELQVSADVALLSYRRGEQTLEINVETSDGGVHVEVLFGEE